MNEPPILRYRLESETDQYWLRPGENTIGSSPRNAVVLSVGGVSRHHAVVVVAGGSVYVRDLESKNGTLLNGSAVSSSPLAIGDRISLGPVALILAAVDEDDAELGLECSDVRLTDLVALEQGSQATATALRSDLGKDRAHLGLVGRFFGLLTGDGATGQETALRALVDHLGARGCAFLESAGTAYGAVLASVGEVETLGEALSDADWGSSDSLGLLTTRRGDWWCVAQKHSEMPLALALRGMPETGEEHTLLLGILLDFLAHVDRRRVVPRTVDDTEGAPLPGDIVPSVTPAMRALYSQIGLLRQGDLPVLILGESGVGKEHIAQLIHSTSRRRGRPFVAINCAAIPSELLEAEMFGIGRGVATGVSPRTGKFQAADGGTLFLDEIGDMSPELQAKLLRALQEREIVPLGRDPLKVDVRVVAATHTDLQALMASGRFRQDLYYRLAGYEMEVPALRQRRSDLPALISHFVRLYGEETGKSVRGVSVKALRRLCSYSWPGNVRELKNIVRRLVYACPDGRAIESSMLPPAILDPEPAEPTVEDMRLGSASLAEHLQAIERRLIRQALDATGNNRTPAAQLLGLSRNGMAYRLRRLGME
ncbi:MAG: sigma 54-interacting transcriptional regulator, partial [Acidobacteriota bacterium]